MLRTLMIATALVLAPTALAAPKQATTTAAVAGQETVSLEVKGLVCDFCARSIEKVFVKKANAQAVKVDLDTGRVDVLLKPGASLSDDLAKKLITDSGYNLVKITRSKAGSPT
jgi:copper chaperone CopZ